MNALDFFKQSLKTSPSNKPYFGWLCTYTPVEILYAAGFIPYGIKKSPGVELQDHHLGHKLCPYVRSIFSRALQGRYGFLKGIVMAHSCECVRRMFDGWTQFEKAVAPQYSYLLNLPTVNTSDAITYFAQNLRHFLKHLEDQFSMKITQDDLQEAIDTYNTMRGLMQRLYQLRISDPPGISATQVMEILELSMTSEVKEFNHHLQYLLEALEKEQNQRPVSKNKQRLLVFSSIFNPELINFIEQEETGGWVVCENACNGLRFFETTVEITTDPLKSIAAAYLNKPPCSRMANQNTVDRLIDLVDQYSVDGVIYYIPKYCENLYLDFPLIREKLDQIDIPYKRLEGEISGDFNKTELKSFIELIALKKELRDFR